MIWRKPLDDIFEDYDKNLIDKIISEINLKKPRSAYTLFLIEKSKSINDKKGITERNKIISA